MRKVLSLIVPGYNIAKTIDCLVESIVDNNRRIDDVEIIIVNDGSKDNTLDVASELKEKYLGLIKIVNKKNGGHGSTINAGLKHISGKYIQVIDGDDWVEKDNFGDFIDYISCVDADLILSPYRTFYEDSQRTEIVDVKYRRENIKKKEVYRFDEIARDLDDIGMVSIVYKSEIFLRNSITIDEGVYYDDNEFVAFPIPYIKTVVFYDLPIYVYRLGQANQSMAASNRWRKRNDLIYILKNMILFYNKNPHISLEKREYLSRYVTKCIDNVYEVYFSFGDKDKKARNELVEFDRYVKQHSSNLYKMTKKRRIKLARMMNFHFYRLFVKN